MSQPPGFVNSQFSNHVCQLKKALYGLRQAPRAWYNELRGFLLSIDFINSQSDTSLFIYSHDPFLVFILLYVDDLVLTGNSPQLLQQVIHTLAHRFSL